MTTDKTKNEFTAPITNFVKEQNSNVLIFNDFIKKVNLKNVELFNKFNPFYTKK